MPARRDALTVADAVGRIRQLAEGLDTIDHVRVEPPGDLWAHISALVEADVRSGGPVEHPRER
jgi:hypothetical protein